MCTSFIISSVKTDEISVTGMMALTLLDKVTEGKKEERKEKKEKKRKKNGEGKESEKGIKRGKVKRETINFARADFLDGGQHR